MAIPVRLGSTENVVIMTAKLDVCMECVTVTWAIVPSARMGNGAHSVISLAIQVSEHAIMEEIDGFGDNLIITYTGIQKHNLTWCVGECLEG